MSGYQRKWFLASGVVFILCMLLMNMGRAAIKLDIVSTITGGTCKISISDGALVILDTVAPSTLDGIGPEDNVPGGKTFSLTVTDCDINNMSSGNGKLNIRFSPVNGAWAGDTFQVLPNELPAAQNGAENVGVAIFSIKDPANIVNVQKPNNNGSTASYPISKADLVGSRYPFYARYQKVNSGAPASSGLLFSQVLVEVSYE